MAVGARRNLWGWSPSVRAFLVGAAVVLSGLLAWVSPRKAASITASESAVEVDPNTAPPGVLLALPRLGPALVGRIVAEREQRPFQSLDDLDRRVKGIGPATANALRPYLRFKATPGPY